jgi:L-threonylcarbamoyladenylate synthase
MFHLSLTPEGGPNLELIAHSLRGGAVAVIPTDTLYGFSARYDRPSAIRRIAALKDRQDDVPFLLLVSGLEQLPLLTPTAPHPTAIDLVWPGPVTLLLPARSGLFQRLRGPGDSVAVRWPAEPRIRELLAQVGVPLVSSSVNRRDDSPLADPEAIASQFGAGIDLLADAGPRRDSRPSTIIDLTRRPPVEVRRGAMTVDIKRLDRLLRLAAHP